MQLWLDTTKDEVRIMGSNQLPIMWLPEYVSPTHREKRLNCGTEDD